MNKYSHMMVGELISEHLKSEHNIHLEKESFIRGNVIPDFSYFAVAHPHFMKLSLGFIQSEIESLSRTYLKSAFVGEDYSFRLGIICHYYADYFCYAHSSGYKQIVVNHLRYEHHLYEYFQKRFNSLVGVNFASGVDSSINADEINSRMLSSHARYSASSQSYENDIISAINACADTALSLIKCSFRLPAEPFSSFDAVTAV